MSNERIEKIKESIDKAINKLFILNKDARFFEKQYLPDNFNHTVNQIEITEGALKRLRQRYYKLIKKI